MRGKPLILFNQANICFWNLSTIHRTHWQFLGLLKCLSCLMNWNVWLINNLIHFFKSLLLKLRNNKVQLQIYLQSVVWHAESYVIYLTLAMIQCTFGHLYCDFNEITILSYSICHNTFLIFVALLVSDFISWNISYWAMLTLPCSGC